MVTKGVVDTARNAGGENYRACILYCLLVCVRWFKIQATVELWDADLHELRAVACEVIAKRMYAFFFFFYLSCSLFDTGLASRARRTRTT